MFSRVSHVFPANKADDGDGLQASLKHVLVLAQCFGLFPVIGVTNRDVQKLKFKWCSVRVCYALCVMLPTFFMALMALYRLFFNQSMLQKLSEIAFYTNCTAIGLVYLHLARSWPSFMVYWKKSASSMNFSYCNNELGTSFNRISAIVLIVAAVPVEHSLSIANACFGIKDVYSDPAYKFFKEEYPFLFNYIPYHISLGIFLKIISFIDTFHWNFLDVFIMLMSLALAEKFKQINLKIKRACCTQEKSSSYWMKIREDFNNLCRLCRRMDDEISNIVLASFANNLFFILVQLYKSLKKRDTYMESIYFFFSFGLLLGRTVAVCLFAARVHDEGQRPLRYMYSIPSSIYNEEVHRLLQQIHTENVALTGKKMFRITRGLIFRIAGTVVTYELFLFQFNVNISNS